MEELKNCLQRLEKIEKKEEEELKTFLQELAQQNEESRRKVQEIYSDVESFIELNQRLVELTEFLEENPEDFINIYQKLKALRNKHEGLEQNILHELRDLGLSDRKIKLLHKTDQEMEKLDNEIVRKVREQRSEHADRLLDDRPRIYFELEALEKFLSAVRREQIGKGAEVPGVFSFEKFKDGYRLKKFLELENTNPNYGTFSLDEQINYVLENFGNERKIIIAHSHPVGDFSHSGTDKDLIEKANGIGVIGVPYDNSIYTVPQILKNGSWVNLPSKLCKNGEVLTEQRTEKLLPTVNKYNNALKKSVSEGSERNWPNLL